MGSLFPRQGEFDDKLFQRGDRKARPFNGQPASYVDFRNENSPWSRDYRTAHPDRVRSFRSDHRSSAGCQSRRFQAGFRTPCARTGARPASNTGASARFADGSAQCAVASAGGKAGTNVGR